MLIWFYVLAIIILGGAVVNELRLERRRPGTLATCPIPKTEELRLEQIEQERQEHARAEQADDEPETEQHERARRARGLSAGEAARAGRGGGRRGQGGVDGGARGDGGQEAEFELAEMEERSDALAEDIEGAKDDWQPRSSRTPPSPAPRRPTRTTTSPVEGAAEVDE